jgi:dTMP kinase
MGESDVNLQGLRGRFIVFDGPEGSGKSTQSRMLSAKLDAVKVPALFVRDPGTTRIGEQVRGMRCEMLLYMAARAQMMAEMISPALAEGKLVICDRFVSSTLAYQLGGEGLTAEEIRRVADVAIRGRWPDLTILLDMPAEESFKRVRREKDRIEQRPMAYHEQVRQNYLSQAKEMPDRYLVLSAARRPDEVHEDIWNAVVKLSIATPGAA